MLARAHLGPSGGYVGPACARFRAYVGPCWPILIDKTENMGKPQDTVNCGMFVGSAAGWAAPLSYGAERTAVRQCHGHVGFLAGYIRIPTARDRWPDRHPIYNILTVAYIYTYIYIIVFQKMYTHTPQKKTTKSTLVSWGVYINLFFLCAFSNLTGPMPQHRSHCWPRQWDSLVMVNHWLLHREMRTTRGEEVWPIVGC